MSSTLYVDGLPHAVNEPQLNEIFIQHGTVTAAHVYTSPDTGQSWGFGFVDMATSEDAKQAIASLNGVELDGHTLKVREARF